MSNFSIFYILHTIVYINDSIIIGMKSFVPLLLLLKIAIPTSRIIEVKNLTITSGILFITCGLLFLFNLSASTLMTLISGNEDEWNFMMSVLTGPNWFQFVIPIFVYGILPNALWIKRIRYSIYTHILIIAFWFVSGFLLNYLTSLDKTINNTLDNQLIISPTEFLLKEFVFLSLLIPIYLIVVSKQKNIK